MDKISAFKYFVVEYPLVNRWFTNKSISMIDIDKKSLKDLILSSLQSGPKTSKDLIEKIGKIRPKTTKQGIYKALRILKGQELIIIHKNLISLNVVWILKMKDYFSTAQYNYLESSVVTGNFINLKEGDKIKYEFKDADGTDSFWIHALHILIKAHPGERWFAYNPHCWFFIVRHKSESALKKFINKNGGMYIMTVGGKTYLDKYILREFDGEINKYHMRDKPMFKQNNYYINIINDFIVEVWIDKRVANKIEYLYKNTSNYSIDIEKELKKIVNSRGRSRLTISRNKIKASKMIKRLERSFFFPKQKTKYQ